MLGSVREWVETTSAVGRRLTDVVVGWHEHGEKRSPVLLFLAFDGQWLEVCTTGAGSLRFARTDEPAGFDMDQYGRFVMVAADDAHPAHQLVGSVVERVHPVVRGRTEIGVVLEGETARVLLLSDWDEVWVSAGDLPLHGYDDAVVVRA